MFGTENGTGKSMLNHLSCFNCTKVMNMALDMLSYHLFWHLYIATEDNLILYHCFQFCLIIRATSGIRYGTLIINLPGSVKGSQECFESVSGSLSHAIALLRDRIEEVKSTHTLIQSNMGNCPSHKAKHSHNHLDHHHQGSTKVR
jgi:hypothetical protein